MSRVLTDFSRLHSAIANQPTIGKTIRWTIDSSDSHGSADQYNSTIILTLVIIFTETQHMLKGSTRSTHLTSIATAWHGINSQCAAWVHFMWQWNVLTAHWWHVPDVNSQWKHQSLLLENFQQKVLLHSTSFLLIWQSSCFVCDTIFVSPISVYVLFKALKFWSAITGRRKPKVKRKTNRLANISSPEVLDYYVCYERRWHTCVHVDMYEYICTHASQCKGWANIIAYVHCPYFKIFQNLKKQPKLVE